jgi:eukaryotic-like serine/threonine-protein kinase
MGGAPPLEATRLKKRWRRYLGRYELVGELARGGMGTVYLARHAGEAGFQRLFAIKVMHPHLAAETDFVDMLRDEARIAARIHHPNVVSIVDLGTLEDIHYVVMEYVEGPSFGTLLKRTGERILPAHVVAVMIDALEGLHAAHTLQNDEGAELNLVHRDISPQNILVGADGLGRITDFGVAKAETRISSTRPGVRKGKLAFMAPEQIKEGDNIDRRADIWAAGVVLWTALTGRHLFKAESDASTVLALLTKDVPPPSTEGHKPPAAFDEVVLKSLNREPAARFESALEMAEALRKVAAASGHSCSRHELAKWVGQVFGEELGLRRQAIREAAANREDSDRFSDATPIGTLPALPAMSSSPNTLREPISNPPGAGGTGSYARTLVEVPGSASSSAQIDERALVARSGRSRLWIAIAALSALLVGAAALLMRSPSGQEGKPAAPPSGLAEQASAPKADPPEQAKESATASAEPTASPLDSAAGAAPAESASADKKLPRVRHGARLPVRRPIPAGAEAPKESPASTEPPLKKPAPAAGTNPSLEKNPYIRR